MLDTWITTENFGGAVQRERRIEFMERVYDISNGGDNRYLTFFSMFLDRDRYYNPGCHVNGDGSYTKCGIIEGRLPPSLDLCG
jgi:hypothetical protein